MRNGQPVPLVRAAVRATIPVARLIDLEPELAEGLARLRRDRAIPSYHDWVGLIHDRQSATALVRTPTGCSRPIPLRAVELYRGALESRRGSAADRRAPGAGRMGVGRPRRRRHAARCGSARAARARRRPRRRHVRGDLGRARHDGAERRGLPCDAARPAPIRAARATIAELGIGRASTARDAGDGCGSRRHRCTVDARRLDAAARPRAAPTLGRREQRSSLPRRPASARPRCTRLARTLRGDPRAAGRHRRDRRA